MLLGQVEVVESWIGLKMLMSECFGMISARVFSDMISILRQKPILSGSFAEFISAKASLATNASVETARFDDLENGFIPCEGSFSFCKRSIDCRLTPQILPAY